jgi:natural product biosynthesis luciferase-like monooxygenase protein
MNDPRKFSCYLIGSESLLVQCAGFLLERGHKILGIVSREKPIVDWAESRGLPVHDPGADLVSELSREPFDYFFSITYLSIIPDEILALPRRGAINFHDGPLPKMAGLNTPAWAILNGEETYGITWHYMTSGVDEGDILKQKFFDIAPGEVSLTLNTKCFEAAIDTFPELVDELARGEEKPQKQDLSLKNYYGKHDRPAAACAIRWDRPAEEISALVRALDYGAYENPLGNAKLLLERDAVLVTRIEVLEDEAGGALGTIAAADEDGVVIAVSDSRIAIQEVKLIDGSPLSLREFVSRYGLKPGAVLPVLSAEVAESLTSKNTAVCKHEAYWAKKLGSLQPATLPYAKTNADNRATSQKKRIEFDLTNSQGSGDAKSDSVVAAFGAFVARVGGVSTFDFGYRRPELEELVSGAESIFSDQVPLRMEVDSRKSLNDLLPSVFKEAETVRKKLTYARDVFARYPHLEKLRDSGACNDYPVSIHVTDDFSGDRGGDSSFLFQVSTDGRRGAWLYDPSVYSEEDIAALKSQFEVFLNSVAANPAQPIAQCPILSDSERKKILVDWNATQTGFPKDACVHELFEAQVERSPDAPALAFRQEELTYRELNERANRLAAYLRKLGVGPEVMVGVYTERSVEMMVAILGTLKAGGAYVPLDPDFPKDRIAFMIEDTQVPVLLTQDRLVGSLPSHHAKIVCLDSDWSDIAKEDAHNIDSGVKPGNLAYSIYTSGSTGKPKGVMVEHHNVVNFFTGMDDRIEHDYPGVWLAVTSLSFDISVLELFWTLARGFKIVLFADEEKKAATAAGPRLEHADKKIDFNFFYWNLASDDTNPNEDKYELLFEGAKYADKNGFNAVWTPERHFHSFGGLYPNPSVTGAALSRITEKVRIRAGSCVLPLHTPIRVAEEWSMVDNFSKGRVDIAFAAGWQPNDFALRPENHADRKNILFRDIEVVRKLWRGETVEFPGPLGNQVSIRTLPRPIQPELPYWVTIAGNPETYEMAGRAGANVLTHLLGQTFEEVAEKIAIYRKAWAEAGYPGRGTVSLMLHTFVGTDMDHVRETVRQPMKDYLNSAMGLVKEAAWHFPTFKKMSNDTGKSLDEIYQDMSAEDLDALLDYAFERYFERSGLFGTPERCLEIVDNCKAIDVDEIACLIDYGIPTATVLEHLPYLKQVLDGSNAQAGVIGHNKDYSIPALIERHQVTHLQCTPSMAGMLTIGDESRKALRSLKQMMVGGEAFPVALANDLKDLVSGKLTNMYGPTETTIWSSTYRIDGNLTSIPIGRPIANTDLYILDANLHPVPVGVVGELFIGGEGVVRGYYKRPELTAERFIAHPFSENPNARLYRTGDLVRYLPCGNVEILGRIDHQVKIRGYRIELGEIESCLAGHEGVREAVVVARQDTPGDARLVGYLVPTTREDSPKESELRDLLRKSLPDYMVPSAIVQLDRFPLTPNGKIDRKALPAPNEVERERESALVAPENEIERKVAEIWREYLNLPEVGTQDNFFELGGHSILAVQVHVRIKTDLEVNLSLTDIFRFPTIRSLAEYLGSDGAAAEAQRKGQDRAEARRESLRRRRDRRGGRGKADTPAEEKVA